MLFLARRFPFDRERWGKSLPVHLVAVLVLTFAHVAMAEGVRYGLAQAGSDVWMKNMRWWTQVSRTYFLSFDWEMMTYWAIIGFWHATAYYRVAQDRALKASRSRRGLPKRSCRRCSGSSIRIFSSTRSTRSRR